MNKNRLPVTILTGFLGSGKTTLLRRLLTDSNQRLAVMINEFGSIGLDGDLIRSCDFCPDDELESRLVELNNGCLCCTVQDDFLPSMEKILSYQSDLDGIIIETSGLALPRPLLQALEWPSIRSKVHINGVITLVDGEAILSGSPVGDLELIDQQRKDDPSLDHTTSIDELFNNQLQSADLVLITRFEMIETADFDQIKSKLALKTRLGTELIGISNGDIAPEIILGIRGTSNIQSPNSSLEGFDHDHDHDHDHLDINSDVLRIETSIQRNELEKILVEFARTYKVIRLKGRCWIEGKTLPLQLQMVGPRINSWFEAVPDNSWSPERSGIEIVILSMNSNAAISLKEIILNH